MVLKMKIPPVVQLVLGALLAWFFAQYAKVFSFVISPYIPTLLCIVAGGFIGFAVLHFREHKTTVNPLDPSQTSDLVSVGVYQVTRNPMYVGMGLLLLAWCMWLGELSALVSVPVFVAAITKLQIEPEEQMLTKLFGGEYATYKRRVSRWLFF